MENAPIAAETATECFARFTVAIDPLAAAVKLLASKVVDKRQTVRVLAGVRIEAAPCGTLTLEATDCETFARVTVEADPLETVDPGAFLVDARNLSDLLAKAKKERDRATLESDGARLTIKCGRNRWQVPELDLADFPCHPIGETEATLSGEMDAAQLLADLKALAPAIGKEEYRLYQRGYVLQRVTLAERDRFTMATCNGGNVAVASRALPAGFEAWPDTIAPASFGSVLQAAHKVAGSPQTVTVERFGQWVAADLGAVRVVSKVIDAEPFDWQRAFTGPLAPVEATEGALFPDLLPGRPIGAMDTLAKAAPVAIEWSEAAQGMLGTSPQDPGLLLGAMNLTGATSAPRKGYFYTQTGAREATEYLQALAAQAGLPDEDTFAEMVRARNEEVKVDKVLTRHAPECPMPVRRAEEDYKNHGLQYSNGRIVGYTVAGVEGHPAFVEVVQDWETLAMREVERAEHWEAVAGSYSILMPADGPQIEPEHSVTVEGDRTYPIATNGAAIHLSKEQVAALCGDSLWDVLAFTGADGRTRYVSQWLWDDGATRLLCVGADGRCPKAGEPREYVTRAEVEAALAGEPVPEAEPVQDSEPAPEAPAVAPEPEIASSAPEIAPLAADPAPLDPIAAIEARLAAVEAMLTPLSGEEAGRTLSGERTKRTAAHERAIRRAWSERKARREAVEMALRQRDARNAADDAAKGLAYDLKRAECDRDRMEQEVLRVSDICRERDAQLAIAMETIATLRHKRRRAVLLAREMKTRAGHYYANWKEEARRAGIAEARAETLAAQLAKAGGDIATLRRKRRANALLARKRTREMVAAVNHMHDRLDVATADLDRAQLAPVYFGAEDGMTRADLAGAQVEHVTRARERAEMLEKALRASNQRAEAAQAAAERGAGLIEAMGVELANAKAALRRHGIAA